MIRRNNRPLRKRVRLEVNLAEIMQTNAVRVVRSRTSQISLASLEMDLYMRSMITISTGAVPKELNKRKRWRSWRFVSERVLKRTLNFRRMVLKEQLEG